jgi:hypothetical protein
MPNPNSDPEDDLELAAAAAARIQDRRWKRFISSPRPRLPRMVPTLREIRREIEAESRRNRARASDR